MKFFEERIQRDGQVFPGNILKVDNFLNHQIDVNLMDDIAEQFYEKFKSCGVTKVLTIEASGIPLAAFTAKRLNVPMVFAKKIAGRNTSSDCYSSKVYSFTKKCEYDVKVAKTYLEKSDRILFIDDFLADGNALKGLMDIVRQAGATAVGAGIAIEKGFQGGGDKLRAEGLTVYSAAIIDKMDENGIVFRKQD